MKLPFIGIKKSSRRNIVAFGGLNRTENYSEGELSACSGISHLEFPFITQKRKWMKDSRYSLPSAIVYAGGEAVLCSDGFYYKNEKKGEVSSDAKQLVPIGDYIVILPDKKYYNISTDSFGNMEAEHTYENLDVTFTENTITFPDIMYNTVYKTETIQIKSTLSLNAYESVSVSGDTISFGDSERKSMNEFFQGEYFRNQCGDNQYRMFISAALDEESGYYTVENELVTIVKLQTPSLQDIKSGDAVEVSGCTGEKGNNGTFIVSEVKGYTISFESNVFKATTENGSIKVKRSVPDFSCACAYENRLWGCVDNTIYASKLGDPFNFHVYRSLSTDSFTVKSNDADVFTACIPCGSYCLFFKENSAYKLFGTKPSNFQLTKTVCSGIGADCQNSLAVFGGQVVFCGRDGVYMYGGGTVVNISEKLGKIKLTDASAGTDGKSYFLAATDDNGVRQMYVYDCEKGLWSIEGETTAYGFSYFNGEMHMLSDDGLYTDVNVPDADARWSVTLHPFNEKHFRTKNYSRLYVCAELWNNAWMQVEVSLDNCPFFTAYTVYGNEKKHLSIPVRTGAYHEIKLRISGKGRCRLESVVREFSTN